MSHIENKTFDEIKIGDSATLARKLTIQDIKLFEALTGNIDPAYYNEDTLKGTLTDDVTVHGLWGGSIISTVLSTQLPGPGTRFVDLSIHFVKRVELGQTLKVTVMAKEKEPSNQQVTFDCTGIGDDGEIIIKGVAVVEVTTDIRDLTKSDVHGMKLRGRPHLRRLMGLVSPLTALRTAVVHPVQKESLMGAIEAAKANLIEPVLVGPEHKIRQLADSLKLDLSPYTIISTEHSHAAASKAVELARSGDVEALMKGSLHTDELMRAVLDKNVGLRTERRMSHVFVFDVPTYPRPLFITDAAINIYPTLEDKKDILQNVLDLAHALFIPDPKVAILSAVETVNPNIKSTIDAAALCKMADRGQITGGTIDGPLAFDNAISETAAHAKGIVSPVAGKADILFVPDVESGNMLAKQLEYLGGAEGAGIVAGARVPIILTSRSDGTTSRMASCAIAVLQAQKLQLKNA